MYIENKCIICEKEANAKNSHIVPMNLIKECIGKRGKEASYNVDIQNNRIVSKKIYIGNELKHKKEEINELKLDEVDVNPYTLDYILCSNCEKELGNIEGKVFSEIICKIRNDKFISNFKYTRFNDFEVLIPNTKKITKIELEIYFYSIILRFITYLKFQKIENNITNETIKIISEFIDSNLNSRSKDLKIMNLGLIVYVTNKPKNHPTFISTNKFEKLIIPMCHFYLILEDKNVNTIFGQAVNLINDFEFKLIKNCEILDEELFSSKIIITS
jgi:hypothetical protein